LQYLPGITGWLERQSIRPLILFWEDTSHAQTPTLQLALKRLIAAGQPYAGIGAFNTFPAEVPRTAAETFICAHHHEFQLFALRPYSDRHRPANLGHLLEQPDWSFLQPEAYDSSWKDSLCCCYAGTQVFPLLSVQTDAESFPAWMVADGRKLPCGWYWRNRLRHLVLGDLARKADHDELWNRYAYWANLA
jgi:hypothetical protein